MFFNAYAFNGQVHVFAGRVKIESHSSCRTSAIFKYFCLLAKKKLTIGLVNSWVILHAFLMSAEFVFKINFLKDSFRNSIRVQNSLDPDQAQHFAEDTSR